jgi:hypothetical protein
MNKLVTVSTMVLLAAVSFGTARELVVDQTFVVDPSNPNWQATPVEIHAGDNFYFFGYGAGYYANGTSTMELASVGQPGEENQDLEPAASLGGNGLVAKIGNNKAFPVGDHVFRRGSEWSGHLYLGFNDTDHSDNSGTFIVAVLVVR